MDIWAYMVGLGIISLIIGILLLMVWRGFFLPTIGETGQFIAMLSGFAFIIAGVMGGALGTLSATPEPDIDVGAVAWKTSGTETMTHLVPITGTNGYEVRVTYNTTTNVFVGQTQYIQVNFTVEREDLTEQKAYTTASVTDVGFFKAVTGTDAGTVRDLIALNSQGDYAVTWTKNSGDSTTPLSATDISAQFPREDSHRDGYISMNVTLNEACFDLMAVTGDSAQFTADIAGDQYYFVCRLNSLLT